MSWSAPQQASDGYTYTPYIQDQDNSCLCACITCFVRLTQNKILDESVARGWVRNAEGGININKEGVRSFHTMGSMGDLCGAVFKGLKVQAFPIKGHDGVTKWIKKVSRAHPAIVSVYWKQWNAGTNSWDDAGGHAVMAVNATATNIIFLDPGIGIVEIPIVNLPVYSVTYPGAASVSQGYMQEMRTT